MKKFIKRLVVTAVIGFAVLGASITALAAGGYINWPGSEAYNSSVLTIELIKKRGAELKEELNVSERTNEQLLNTVKDKENVIKDRENVIKSKEQEVAAKQKEIDDLKNSGTTNSNQLKQAETDMKDIDQKAKDALNSLK